MHRLDPRVKLLTVFALVILTFAAKNWWQLCLVAIVPALSVLRSNAVSGPLRKMLWLLKWLLLFTFLVHLLFTPGRTLWGVSWLSYDGLLIGAFVCLQIIVSVMLASLMALTTPVQEIVGGMGWVASPLSRLGVNTRSWERLMIIALDFLPVVHREMLSSGKKQYSTGPDSEQKPHDDGRWELWTGRLKEILAGLIDHGDRVAHELADEEDGRCLSEDLAPMFPVTLLDRTYLLSLVSICSCYWLAGQLT